MPIYEYQCKICNHQFDAMQKMNEAPLTQCPVCHKESVTKLVSAAGFQLKGTGWYVTDFRDKGKPKPQESDSPKSESSTQAGTKSTTEGPAKTAVSSSTTSKDN